MAQPRHPKGTPDGGQFASSAHGESATSLVDRVPDIEPDFDHYADAADGAILVTGLGSMQVRDRHGLGPYWSSYGPGEGIGATIRGTFSDIETDYLPVETAAAVATCSPTRRISMTPFSRKGEELAASWNQYVSIRLTEDEAEAVAAAMEADGDEFVRDKIGAWSEGNPGHLEDTFGPVSLRSMWDDVSDHVRTACPGAGHDLGVAEQLRTEMHETFLAEADYLGSDEWKIEEAQRREDFDD